MFSKYCEDSTSFVSCFTVQYKCIWKDRFPLIFLFISLEDVRGSSLSFVHCSLCFVRCVLFSIRRSLFIVGCSLWAVGYLLCGCPVSCLLIRCSLFTVRCSLFAVHCSLLTVHCSLFTVYFPLFTFHCFLFSPINEENSFFLFQYLIFLSPLSISFPLLPPYPN